MVWYEQEDATGCIRRILDASQSLGAWNSFDRDLVSRLPQSNPLLLRQGDHVPVGLGAVPVKFRVDFLLIPIGSLAFSLSALPLCRTHSIAAGISTSQTRAESPDGQSVPCKPHAQGTGKIDCDPQPPQKIQPALGAYRLVRALTFHVWERR